MAFSCLLAEKFSYSAIVSKKEFAILSNFRFIGRTNLMLSCVENKKRFITSGPKDLYPTLRLGSLFAALAEDRSQ